MNLVRSYLLSVLAVFPSLAFVSNPTLSLSSFGARRQLAWLLRSSPSDDSSEDEAARLRSKADELREQVRKMEEALGDRPRNAVYQPEVPELEIVEEGISLRGKKVLVAGANGRLGSMVCRYLLRNHPETKVVAAVHVVGENSPTARGYGRLSYEVGAEDGIGSIGPAWNQETRTATFRYSDEMKDYNLQNIRVVEVELLDPVQCNTVTEGIDSIIWCATDFNGNTPRAVSGLNVAFLFRAVTVPDKGRVEIEGLRNLLAGLKNNLRGKAWEERDGSSIFPGKSTSDEIKDPVNVVLVSTAPFAFENYETPFGEFNAIKREAEDMLKNEFPSLSYTVLQMGRYEDNFVGESLDVVTEESKNDSGDPKIECRRLINRRDAARAASEALVDEELVGKTVQVWTVNR